MRVDVKRTEIAKHIPNGFTFALRNFKDPIGINGDDKMVLDIKKNGEKLPSIFAGKAMREAWLPAIEARKFITENFMYKNKVII